MRYHRKTKGVEGKYPQPPNLCEVGFGANNYCIINICENVNFDPGKMGECCDLFTEIKNGVFEEEANESRGEAFPMEHAINYRKRTRSRGTQQACEE